MTRCLPNKVSLDLPAGWRLATELTLLEHERGEAELNFTPFQVHSWLLERTKH
ncbi:MAG: hypothetical protein M3511_05815 [Deinococcota bacterium]|nr:hypothetical protein [Deinococcota bacterium]